MKTTDELKVGERKYKVFISYRHADNREQGRQWATWLHHAIETYEVPKDLVDKLNSRGQKIPERIFPVFRDEEELSADSNLASSIINALDNSDYLIAICSPQAVASTYVAEEISYFKQIGKGDNLLAMLVDGEPNSQEDECFPMTLRFDSDEAGNLSKSVAEPIAADFRIQTQRSNKAQQGWTTPEAYRQDLEATKQYSRSKISAWVDDYSKQHELMKLKIISGILDIPLARLSKRDQAYQILLANKRAKVLRRWLMTVGLLAALAVGGGIFAWLQKQEAVRQEAQATQNFSLQLTAEALDDLKDAKLEEGLAGLTSSLHEWPDNQVARDRLLFELAYRGWLFPQKQLPKLPEIKPNLFGSKPSNAFDVDSFDIEYADVEGKLIINQQRVVEGANGESKLISRKLQSNAQNTWSLSEPVISEHAWDDGAKISLPDGRTIVTLGNAEVPLAEAENYVQDANSDFSSEKRIENANGITAISPDKKTFAVAGFRSDSYSTNTVEINFFDTTTLKQDEMSFYLSVPEDLDVNKLYWEADNLVLISNVRNRPFPRIDILKVRREKQKLVIENMIENHLVPGKLWDFHNGKLYVSNSFGLSVYQPMKASMKDWSAKEYQSTTAMAFTPLPKEADDNGNSWKYLNAKNSKVGLQAKMKDGRNVLLSDLQGNTVRTIEASTRGRFTWNDFRAMGFSPNGKILALSALNNPSPGEFYFTWELYSALNSLKVFPETLSLSGNDSPPMLREMFEPLEPFGWMSDSKALVFKNPGELLPNRLEGNVKKHFSDHWITNTTSDTDLFVFQLRWADQPVPPWFLEVINQLIHVKHDVVRGLELVPPSQQMFKEQINDVIQRYGTNGDNKEYVNFLKMLIEEDLH